MDFSESTSKSFGEIIAPFRIALQRYGKFSIAPALAIFGVILVIDIFLPSYYSSEVLIFVQEQRLPNEVIKEEKEEKMHDRLDNLMQQILARSTLRDIIERFDLYPHLSGIIGKEKAVTKFRKNTNVSQINSPTGKPISNTFQLTFTHHSPDVAFNITKALSQMFIEKSILDRKEANESAKRFLRAEIKKTKDELEEIEDNLREFKKKNIGALPDQLQPTITDISEAQKDLETNSALKIANREKRRALQAELRLASSGLSNQTQNEQEEDPETLLPTLTAQRDLLLKKYYKNHPEVVSLETKIKSLKAELKKSRILGSGSGGDSILTRQLRLQISSLDAEYARLVEEDQKLNGNISTLKKELDKMPTTQQELKKIKRDYDVTQVKYQSLLAQKDKVEIEGEAIRSLRDAQFKVIEPASKPAIPDGPPRIMIAIAALILGVLTLLLTPMLLFFANGAYKFRDDIENDLGLTVLSTVPPMMTQEVKTKNRKTFINFIIFSTILFIMLSSAFVVLLVTKIIDL